MLSTKNNVIIVNTVVVFWIEANNWSIHTKELIQANPRDEWTLQIHEFAKLSQIQQCGFTLRKKACNFEREKAELRQEKQ